MQLRSSFASMAFLVVAGLAILTLTGAGDPQDQEFEYATRIRPAALNDAELAKVLDTAKAAGITSVDVEVVWRKVDQGDAGGERRTYDWSDIDRLVQGAEARGMEVTFLLLQTPDWVHPDLEQTEPDWQARAFTAPKGEAELQHWSNFVGDVVGRYKGRVSHYEIWNEPNHPFFWQPEPGPAEYAALLRAAYLSAKAADPEATVVFGGLSRNDLGYLNEFYRTVKASYPDAADQKYYFDVLDVHPYSSNRSPDQYLESKVDQEEYGEVDGNFLGFTGMKELMEEEGDSGKSLFLGEYGFSTDPGSFKFVPDSRRALYLKRAYELAREMPYVEGLSWYAYHPNPSDSPDMAIVCRDYSPTLTYRAYRQVTGARVPSPPKSITVALPVSVSGTYSIEPKRANLRYDDIRRWELYVDGALVRQQFRVTAPIQWDSRSVEDGTHKVMVAAYTERSVWHSDIAETYTENSVPAAPAITEPADNAYNSTGNISLSGTAEAGSTVTVFEDGASKGVTTADARGRWSKALTGVAEGSHTYTATATDKAGNTSPASAALTITVDTVAPETTIDDGPSGTTDSTTAEFAFSSEANATFECSLDGDPFGACSSPKGYSGLAVGEHTFEVRATDVAGNTDATPARRAWTVEAAPN